MYHPLHEHLPLLECGVVQVHNYQADDGPHWLDRVCPDPVQEGLDFPFALK